jgi:hypothetical protein
MTRKKTKMILDTCNYCEEILGDNHLVCSECPTKIHVACLTIEETEWETDTNGKIWFKNCSSTNRMGNI